MADILILFAAGILGILTINLIEIDKLNQASVIPTNLKKYISKHWANMALSLCMVVASLIGREYITSLQLAGKSLFWGMFSIGMCGPIVAGTIRAKVITFLKIFGRGTTAVIITCTALVALSGCMHSETVRGKVVDKFITTDKYGYRTLSLNSSNTAWYGKAAPKK